MDIKEIRKLRGVSHGVSEYSIKKEVDRIKLLELLEKYRRKVEECRRLREEIKKLEGRDGRDA